MKKMALIGLVAAGLLALAGTAQAKEIASLKICGASGCNEVTDRNALQGWEPEGNANAESVAIAAPQAFYTVDIAFGDGQQIIHRDTAYWLPETNLFWFRGQPEDSWWKLFPGQISMFQNIASGIGAFTPKLSKVTVKGKAVADPSSYLRLFGRFRYIGFPSGRLHLFTIALRASEPNPWVTGTVLLRYDAGRRVLVRPDGYFKLPRSLAKLVLKRASLAASSTASSGSGGHAALYAGVGAGLAAALAVLAVAGRKRMH